MPPSSTQKQKTSFKNTTPAPPPLMSQWAQGPVTRGAFYLSTFLCAYSRREVACNLFAFIHLLSQMPESNTEDEVWIDCDACPYTEKVCRYVTHTVLDELFQHIQTNPTIHHDYFLYTATHQSLYAAAWKRLFLRRATVAGPFHPYPPHTPRPHYTKTRASAIPSHTVTDALLPPSTGTDARDTSYIR